MRHWLCLAILITACGDDGNGTTDPPDPPTEAQISDARTRLDSVTDDLEQVRTALVLIGILPTYTCGEPQGGYVGLLMTDLDGRYGCADVTVDSLPARDVVTVDFPTACEVEGTTFEGTMTIGVAAGESSFLLELDVTALTVDGRNAPVVASYGECGDETRYGAIASGTGWSFDVVVAKRSGIPVIGGTTLIIDGTGTRNGDTLTLTGLEYEIGDTLPKNGRIHITTADGHTIQATFTEASPVHLEVEVVIDSHDPVTIYLPA